MALFPRWTNTVARLTGALTLGAPVLILGFLWMYVRTPFITNQGLPIDQPVQFDHRHHVKDEGIDCRYCHNTVDRSPSAGLPATQVCLNCHSQVWNKSPLLEPVRESFFQNKPIEWRRVHKVPEFVYFNHAIHVNKGVGCVTCHGRVDEMPAVEKATPLTMGWCLECHRRPEQNIRPLEEVTNMEWKPEGDPEEAGRLQAAKNNVHTRTSCTTCHR